MGKRTERWGEGVVYPGQWEKGQARGMDRQRAWSRDTGQMNN